MGFLSKLTGRGAEDKRQAQEHPRPAGGQADGAVECIHGTLIPRWDRAEDMGYEDRVVSYTCESCSRSLTPDEARAIMATEAHRLRI